MKGYSAENNRYNAKIANLNYLINGKNSIEQYKQMN